MGDTSLDRQPTTRSRHEQEELKYAWALLLGISGLVDILGTVLPDFATRNGTSRLEHEQCDLENSLLTSYWKSTIAWLDLHDILISFIFSALWFLDAFWTASQAKHYALERTREYELLNERKDAKPLNWRQNARFAYFWSISLQLLCLPVGFYGVLYFGIHRIILGGSLRDLEHLEDDVWDLVEVGDDGMEHHEIFSVRSTKAFIVAIVQHFSGRTARSVMRYVKSRVIALARTLTKRIFSRAIYNPIKFRRQVKKVLKILRYLKYGFPLFGKFNRIRGLVVLAWKRQRQRREAQKAKRARQLLWESKPRKVREIDAAVMIQSVFRARQARKAVQAMRVLKADREYLAICKIQNVLRRKLRGRRAHLEARRKELKRLEQLEEHLLSDKDKLCMYQLRHEVLDETRVLLNRKMLMRPNTKFSVYWKLFFAICLLWEWTGAALQPFLQDKSSKSPKQDGGPTTVEELIAKTFVPTRVSDWPSCKIEHIEEVHGVGASDQLSQENEDIGKDADWNFLPWYCNEPFSTTQELIRDALALALIPNPVSEWSECSIDSTPPRRRFNFFGRKLREEGNEVDELDWYCQKPYATMHQLYRNLVDWFWSEFVVLVGVAYFLDVFVTFFTGEFHPRSGALVPKPFFPRWILPGLVLQLAVNPYLKAASGWTSSLVRNVAKFGPVRVYRWNATVLFPLFFFLWKRSLLPVWLALVEFENKHDLIPDDALL